jgi:Thiamine pyrophosphate enzyme, N-terminal TPP binding domain
MRRWRPAGRAAGHSRESGASLSPGLARLHASSVCNSALAAAPKTRVGKIDYKAPVTEHVAHHDTCQSVTHGGDRVALALQAHGVRLLFALCGGHISPILVGAKARGLQVVDVRDEATSVFAADAVARLTGAPGVAAVTAGPGVANTLTALKDAQLAQSPVVVLVGAAPTALQDNLNIHSKASLYEAFPAAEPRRLVERFEWHYTPKHGTYLPNQANPPLPSRLRGNERNKLYPFLNPRRRSILPMRRSSSTGLGHSPD